jgi:hypothetical protein
VRNSDAPVSDDSAGNFEGRRIPVFDTRCTTTPQWSSPTLLLLLLAAAAAIADACTAVNIAARLFIVYC